jgi:hypothetical protein
VTSLPRLRKIRIALRVWRRRDELVVRKDLFDDAFAEDRRKRS